MVQTLQQIQHSETALKVAVGIFAAITGGIIAYANKDKIFPKKQQGIAKTINLPPAEQVPTTPGPDVVPISPPIEIPSGISSKGEPYSVPTGQVQQPKQTIVQNIGPTGSPVTYTNPVTDKQYAVKQDAVVDIKSRQAATPTIFVKDSAGTTYQVPANQAAAGFANLFAGAYAQPTATSPPSHPDKVYATDPVSVANRFVQEELLKASNRDLQTQISKAPVLLSDPRRKSNDKITPLNPASSSVGGVINVSVLRAQGKLPSTLTAEQVLGLPGTRKF